MENGKNLTVAYLLCIFLGGLGIHRFYYGRWMTGLIWMGTGGLFLVGWIVDLFLLPGIHADSERE